MIVPTDSLASLGLLGNRWMKAPRASEGGSEALDFFGCGGWI
jgi:hypothetical protein